MADIDAPFMQEIFDVAKGRRKSDVHHHGEANDLWRRLEISEWLLHPWTVGEGRWTLKHFCLTAPLLTSKSQTLFRKIRRFADATKV